MFAHFCVFNLLGLFIRIGERNYPRLHKTVQVKNGAELFWREKKLYPTDRVFFQSLGKKNKKQKFVTRNPGDTMCVSGYGYFFCLWAVRARSNQRRALIGLWVTPPTTGSIEIERGGDENITINHGCGGGDCGRRRSWPLRPPLGRPRPFQSTERVDRVMGDAVNDRLHRNRVGGVIKNRQGRHHELGW